MKEKTPLSHEDVWFQVLDFGTSIKFKNLVENYFFVLNYVSSEGGVSHNVLYFQQLSIACYRVKFYAYNYFE